MESPDWSRYPHVSSNAQGRSWLTLLSNLGRAPATTDAYARSLNHYLDFCQHLDVPAELVTLEQIALYIRYLRGDADRPTPTHPVSNATLQQRITAIRLWYDHLVYQGIRERNPVPRGRYLDTVAHALPGQAAFSHGLVRRVIKLPTLPSEEQWQRLIMIMARQSLRNRLMFALSYYGALRREELVGLHITDFDFAHRLITIRPETSKGSRGRVVCYAEAAGQALVDYLQQRRSMDRQPGALFLSESKRNYGRALSKWTWSKVIEEVARQAGVDPFSTHTLRHLRLTHLARAGWTLHELSAYAGHRNPQTTLMYLHLSGRDLSAKVAASMHYIDAKVDAVLFRSTGDPL